MVILKRRWLDLLAKIALLTLVILACWSLGRSISPHTIENGPVLFTPATRGVIQYREQVRAWVEILASMETEMSALLDKPPTDPYELANRVNILLAESEQLQEVIIASPSPDALVGLRELCELAGLAHQDAAAAIGRWAGAPSTDNHLAAQDAVDVAQETLGVLNQSPWTGVDEIEHRNSNDLDGMTITRDVWGE